MDMGFEGTGGARAFLSILLVVFVLGILVFSPLSPTAYQVGDTKPPSLSVTTDKISYYTKENIKFEATANDDVGVSRIDIYVDNELAKSCEATPCQFVSSYPSAGRHTYYAKASDNAGNVGIQPPQAPKVPKSFVVLQGTAGGKQTTSPRGPDVTVTHSPLNPGLGEKITITSVAVPQSGKVIRGMAIYVDGKAAPLSCTGSLNRQRTCTYSTSKLSSGKHPYSASSQDSSKQTGGANGVVVVSGSRGGQLPPPQPPSGNNGATTCQPPIFPAVEPAPGCKWEYEKDANSCITGRHASCTPPTQDEGTSSTTNQSQQQTSSDKCSWRPPTGAGCAAIQPNAFYFNGRSCQQFSGCSVPQDIPFKSLEDCQTVCGPK